MKNKPVIVALSGGVDSSVVAALLQQHGAQVEGVFMKNWSPRDSQSLQDCPWLEDQADAMAVCEKLGIPFRSINFEKEYWEKVVQYFLDEYAAGRTPNPDVMCNKEIKFKVFLDEALRRGIGTIATGHYARKVEREGRIFVGRGLDVHKDQSYFLWSLRHEQLEHVLFPLGELEKTRTRELAAEFGLPTASKKDSQGICFIGHIDLKKFLAQYIQPNPGEVYCVSPSIDGFALEERLAQAKMVGKHQGVAFYTAGERAKSAVDNKLYSRAFPDQDVPPLYILTKDLERNRVYVTPDREDAHLMHGELLIEQPALYVAEGELIGSDCQVRYGQLDCPKVVRTERQGECLRVWLSEPVWAAAPGQSAVFYQDDAIIGGGIIREAR